MDNTRFDNFARSFAAGSRRRFLAGVTAALGGAIAARGASAQTACPEGQVNRRGVGCICRSTGRPADTLGCPCPDGQVEGTQCAAGKVCLDGFCQGNGVCNASNVNSTTCGGAGCNFNDLCLQTLEAGFVCVAGNDAGDCSASSQCGPGRACVFQILGSQILSGCSNVCSTAAA